MTTGRLIHFGIDDCGRIPVLTKAGFAVETCDSLPALASSLRDCGDPDAVVVTEGPYLRRIAETVRARSGAALILFLSSLDACDDSAFDLVVAPLTMPAIWLERVACVIRRSRDVSSPATAERQRGHLGNWHSVAQSIAPKQPPAPNISLSPEAQNKLGEA